MSQEDSDTCHFGHVLLAGDHEDPHDPTAGLDSELLDRIRKGKIRDLEQLEREGHGIGDLVGGPYKHLKVSAGSAGFPRTAAFAASDVWFDDMDYTGHKTEEKIFVSPQSNLHNEYMQRKQQAEQNIRNTMQNLSQLKKQKHMLEHDIRKLRSRAESLNSRDESQIKGDFIELVDGAGAAGQQGGDEASLKFYRDNNIFPSIVADFNEMSGLEDLEDGPLEDVPRNEKAVLRKKYSMYEKWKDLYGSEINRRLKELKEQLNSIERSIEQTEEWLKPYAQDMKMIEQRTQDELEAQLTQYFTNVGTASMVREMEFIGYKPMEKEGNSLKTIEDESEATHFRVIYIDVTHVNLAGWENPQSPANGPSAAIMQWYPVITCRHVFERFFKRKIERSGEELEQLISDYIGELDTEHGDRIKDAREGKDLRVRELREKVEERVKEDGSIDRDSVPLEFSSTIRRLEDGLDQPEDLKDAYGEELGAELLEKLEEVLDIELKEEEDTDSHMYGGTRKKLRKFLGQTDEYVIPSEASPLQDFREHVKFDFYYDYKLGLGLYTMK